MSEGGRLDNTAAQRMQGRKNNGLGPQDWLAGGRVVVSSTGPPHPSKHGPGQPALSSAGLRPSTNSTTLINPRQLSNEPHPPPQRHSRDTRTRARGGALRWPSHGIARLAHDVLVGDELGVCRGVEKKAGCAVVECGSCALVVDEEASGLAACAGVDPAGQGRGLPPGAR